jgi:hypothetical protein
MKLVKPVIAFAAVYGLLTIVWVVGCSEPAVEVRKSNYDGAKFVLPSEPTGGQNVIEARESSSDGEYIVIIGRIGGGLNPWVDDRAAFTIVDPTLLACSDAKEDGETCSCKTPWDYCCETDKLAGATALVKFVESDGSVVGHDARAVFGLTELQTVVIQGTADRDDAGNLTVLATGMFVKP